MRPFEYERAADPASAIKIIHERADASYLAGGTNLVDLMKLGVATPAKLVDVTRLHLDGIETMPSGSLRIDAGVTNSELAANPEVRTRYPVLSQALLAGASGQLRNRASVGGNLLQRTRCPYFQDVSKPCNKREPGSGCPAREGSHRELAVIGHSEHCVATHPSDMAVALAALDAIVHVETIGGRKQIPVAELHRLPGDEPQRDTVLEPSDLIVAVELPASALVANSHYRKVRDRASYAFGLVSVAAALSMRGPTVTGVRIAFGQLAAKPWRATVAEEKLLGGPATAEMFAAAADAELAVAQPLPENAFKLELARNLMIRTLSDLMETAR